jgi:hypothetical protein
MFRLLLAALLAAVALSAANFKLYLKDGSYHLVREYQVQDDRVRFYTVERSDWEEIPLSLVDLKRTDEERAVRDEEIRKNAAELTAEDKFEREQREEIERVPQEPGVYLLDAGQIKALPIAESKQVSSKKRSVLKVLSPVPLITGKTDVEIAGLHAANTASSPRPEFYVRFVNESRISIVRTSPKKQGRVVQRWDIIPVTKELIESQDEVEIYRKQIADGLYKIWPTAPLAPGEYAVIQYASGKGDVQIWDFAAPGRTSAK